MGTGRIRLQDVASRAGVSIKTVSNVVNGTGSVTAATQQKVESALRELPYRPNLAARHLRRGTTGLVAVALPELTQPYFAELASELVRAAKAHGRIVLLSQTDGTEEAERALLSGVDLPVLDGLVLSPLALTAATLRTYPVQTPLVLLGEHIGPSGFNLVTIDNRRAAAEATGHLLDRGRRRVAAIGAQLDGPNETALLRLAGYHDALDRAGVPRRAELVAVVEHFHRPDGAAAMDRLLALPEPPDAVFCFNDALALGAMHTLASRGLDVPGDVAVVGIDDVEEGRFANPALTTISPDKRAVAATALELLLAPAGTEPRTVTVEHRLLPRQSTAAAGTGGRG
ncbi:LacI family transcriptional regulator [Georgenia sp. TF02-10]|uniref:LacI family DNA-binding transcriptional regulator n=1 Tax=Georgenia sp. TF02-10 TaxID=2917725 RepID=UPI001FA7124E|nr:LacI family DNA-binding transcriptional regulator [Georgenia sp. TF02-10]UNX55718.1 LacI family transcriptional regulator [Georgenia sp. TF02-10]